MLWPPLTSRRVYEFLSFEEFRLDLRRMIVEEVDADARWLSVVAFLGTLLTGGLRWLVGAAERRRITTRTPGTAMAPNEPSYPPSETGSGSPAAAALPATPVGGTEVAPPGRA